MLGCSQLVAQGSQLFAKEKWIQFAKSPKHTTAHELKPKRNSLLLAEAESLNDRFVALGIVLFEVVEQATPLADQHEKTAA